MAMTVLVVALAVLALAAGLGWGMYLSSRHVSPVELAEVFQAGRDTMPLPHSPVGTTPAETGETTAGQLHTRDTELEEELLPIITEDLQAIAAQQGQPMEADEALEEARAILAAGLDGKASV